ncbi:MAG: amidase [Alphaproteobacteria bacterium]|nr:amidase [Alphaproteobacteria bacterium]
MKPWMWIVGGVGSLVAFGGITFVALNWAALSTFPAMPSSYEAKEYCSCRWVSGRDDAFCERFVAQSTVPMQGREVDEVNRRVTSRALWTSNSARYVDARRGCVLEK